MKNMIYIDFERYTYENKNEYAKVVKKIFKNEVIQLTEDKVKLIQKMIELLPIRLVGNAEEIKIKTIVNMANSFLRNADDDKTLIYESKKIYCKRHGKVYYPTQYKFYLKD